MMAYAYLIASVYGSGNYDTSNYNGSSTTTSGGLLTNTGLDIAVIVTLACVMTLVAVAVRISRRSSVQQEK
jgi:hypothetical protein